MFDLVLFQLLGSWASGDLSYRHLARSYCIGIVLVRIASGIGLEKRRWRSKPDVEELRDQRAAMLFDCPRHPSDAFHLLIIPKARECRWSVDRILLDDLTAKDDHSQSRPRSLLIVGDRLIGKDPFVCVP